MFYFEVKIIPRSLNLYATEPQNLNIVIIATLQRKNERNGLKSTVFSIRKILETCEVVNIAINSVFDKIHMSTNRVLKALK